jgi:hypothetical protein
MTVDAWPTAPHTGTPTMMPLFLLRSTKPKPPPDACRQDSCQRQRQPFSQPDPAAANLNQLRATQTYE